LKRGIWRDGQQASAGRGCSLSLVPYLLAAACALKPGARGETYDTAPQNRNRELLVAGLATFCTGVITI
jgi:hypothetical protein